MSKNIRTVQELLGHKEITTTRTSPSGEVYRAMIYTHVLNRGGHGVQSPADRSLAGYATAFRFNVKSPGATHHGIGVLDFDRTSRKIAQARFFWDE